MSRPLLLAGALVAASLAITSTSSAQSPYPVRFSLERASDSQKTIRASFHREKQDGSHDSWSTTVMPSDLIGLEVSSFHGAGAKPIHFTVKRDAGRLDCSGMSNDGRGNGSCTFVPDPAFTQLLVRSGIGRPDNDQSFALVAVNARRDLIEAMNEARYPAPRINDLIALAALGVDRRYVSDLARAGYRPRDVQKLVEFKALGISPAWIGGFARVGYSDLPGDGLVQMRALGITPDYIAGFQRIGYHRLPVSTLVQLKALEITPEFVRSVAGPDAPLPSVDKLAELKMFARRH